MAWTAGTRRLALWLPPLAYMAVIFVLSAQSDPLPSVTSEFSDKLLHAVEYLGLALLVARAVAGEGVSWPWSALLTAAIVSAFGASDEWHQAFVPFRTPELADWLVDTVAGAVGGSSFVLYWRRRSPAEAAPASTASHQPHRPPR
jgi:VanZ family protein